MFVNFSVMPLRVSTITGFVLSAMGAVDRWAQEANTNRGDDADAPALVRDLVDALLGVEL